MIETMQHDKPEIKTFKSQLLFKMKKQAEEFCVNTGLHGYKYIGYNRRTKFERYISKINILFH